MQGDKAGRKDVQDGQVGQDGPSDGAEGPFDGVEGSDGVDVQQGLQSDLKVVMV